jgi:hypothetical protein
VTVKTEHPGSQPIKFFIPYQDDGIKRLPDRYEDFWTWLIEDEHVVGRGKYTWTLQTFLSVREAGYPCELVQELPDSGIVVSHRDFLPVFMRPRANMFLVCIKADRNPHSWADFHVVQNERDPLRVSAADSARSAAVPFWPQPSLRPRDPARGARVENVAYFGRPLNLVEELLHPDWAALMRADGCNWLVPPRSAWHDYREIDVTVAVRTFDTRSLAHDPVRNVDSKPASKLINSWIAGVPAVLGREPAFQCLRRSPLDYIEVDSMQDLRAAIKSLRDNPDRYREMVEHGLKRGAEFSPRAVTDHWIQLLNRDIADRHTAWTRQSWPQRLGARYWRFARYLSIPQHVLSVLRALAPRGERVSGPVQTP